MSINIPKDKIRCFCSKCKIGGGKTISRRTYALHARNDIIPQSSSQMDVTTRYEVLTADINESQFDSDHYARTDNFPPEHIMSNDVESPARRRHRRGAATDFCDDDYNNVLTNNGIEDEIQLDDCEEEIDFETVNQNTIGSSGWRPSYRPVKLSSAPPILSEDLAIKWVLFWVFMFQQAYVIQKAAIFSLLHFLSFLFLKLNISELEYERFPDTNYKTYKMFSYDDEICNYYVCPECHFKQL